MEYRFMGDQVMDDGVVIISGVERERAREMTIGRMKCMSCKEEYFEEKAGTCKECYDEASETEEELKKEIEELRANISFLRLSPPHSSLSQHFSDLQIETPCGRCIPAHKAVLMSKSPVFRAMLENNMEESRSSTIKITDITYEVMFTFIDYLYTAEVTLDEEKAFDLLVVAEKYEVQHLKNVCEKYLTATLNVENSLASFAFAHKYNAKHLTEASLSLILDNMQTLTTRDEYRELVAGDPRLVVEIYESYLAKQANTAA